jgi:hypothetical protein
MGSWLAAWLRRGGLEHAADGLVTVGIWINRLPVRLPRRARAAKAPRHERLARELLRSEDVDLVVLGHSHRLAARRFPTRGYYANGGNCSFGRLCYASLEIGLRGSGEVRVEATLFEVSALARWDATSVHRE